MRLLWELNEQGSTLVIVTHEHEIAASLPRQIEVRDGKVVRDEHTSTPHSHDTEPSA